jgi:hypothetical protein
MVAENVDLPGKKSQHCFSAYHKNTRIPKDLQQNVYDRPQAYLMSETLKWFSISYMRSENLTAVKMLMVV